LECSEGVLHDLFIFRGRGLRDRGQNATVNGRQTPRDPPAAEPFAAKDAWVAFVKAELLEQGGGGRNGLWFWHGKELSRMPLGNSQPSPLYPPMNRWAVFFRPIGLMRLREIPESVFTICVHQWLEP
jgi:hypothetical protein